MGIESKTLNQYKGTPELEHINISQSEIVNKTLYLRRQNQSCQRINVDTNVDKYISSLMAL